MKHSRKVLAAAAAALCLTAPTSPATAAPEVSDPIAGGMVGPLQFSVGHRGQAFVGENFAGLLTKVGPGGAKKVLHAESTGEVGGVASRRGEVVWTYTEAGSEEALRRSSPLARRANPLARGVADILDATLRRRTSDGKVRTVADLAAFEMRRNPDGGTRYGFRNLSDECAAQVPEEVGAGYNGIVESHPYAVANAPGGGWYVADAAGNDIVHVSKAGKVKLVAVLPGQRMLVTSDVAESNGLPECTVGKGFYFEPVPTDVEVDPNGRLVVSLLPGGPEDPSLGARGAIYRINPATGVSRKLAGGFVTPTNLAIGKGDRIYVAELFANQISVLRYGGVKRTISVPTPGAVEYRFGKLWATINAMPFGEGPPDGQLVTIE